MPKEYPLYLDNDNLVRFTELKDESKSANSFLDGTATVQMTLFDLSGTTVSGMTFPVSLTYNSAKGRGTFDGTLENDLSLVSWEHYDLMTEISGSGIPDGKIWTRYYCVVRGKYNP